jgi:hypothetical protein
MKLFFLRRYLIGAALSLLAGCATTAAPVKFANSAPVPADRLSSGYAQYQNATSGTRVVVVRDTGGWIKPPVGGAINGMFEEGFAFAALYVDGTNVAHLAQGESVVLYLQHGSHLLGIAHESSPSATPATGHLEEQELVVREDSKYFYRITIDPYKGMILQRSSLLE